MRSSIFIYLWWAIIGCLWFVNTLTKDSPESNIYSVGLNLLLGIVIIYSKLDEMHRDIKKETRSTGE